MKKSISKDLKGPWELCARQSSVGIWPQLGESCYQTPHYHVMCLQCAVNYNWIQGSASASVVAKCLNNINVTMNIHEHFVNVNVRLYSVAFTPYLEKTYLWCLSEMWWGVETLILYYTRIQDLSTNQLFSKIYPWWHTHTIKWMQQHDIHAVMATNK